MMTASGPDVPVGQSTRIDAIDGMRALAVTAVFAFHSWEFAGRPEIPIVSAVVSQNIRPDFFVVLTGFVLFMPFARRPERLGTFRGGAYVWRRVQRIVLPYYVALAYAVLLPQTLVILMRVLGREASWQPMPEFGDVVAHLTFSHLFFPEYWSSMNGSLWTMSLEMQLYLLFPLLIVAVARWGLPVLWWALGASIVFRVLVALLLPGPSFPDHFLWGASGVGRLMEFIAGMLAAIVVFQLKDRVRRSHLIGLATAMVGAYFVATAPLRSAVPFPLREVGLSILFGALIIIVLALSVAQRVFAFRPFAYIGYRSYSIFLIHQPTIWYFSEFLQKVLGMKEGIALLAVLWTVGFGVVFVVGQVLFITVERPCIRWAKKTPVQDPPADTSPDISRT